MKKLSLILILNIFAFSEFAIALPRVMPINDNKPQVNLGLKKIQANPKKAIIQERMHNAQSDNKLGNNNYELKGETQGDKLGANDYKLKEQSQNDKSSKGRMEENGTRGMDKGDKGAGKGQSSKGGGKGRSK